MHVGVPDARTSLLSKKLVLFLHIRVVLMVLAKEDEELHDAAMRAVHCCKREGVSVHRAILSVAGERRWRQAEQCCKLILESKRK